MQRKYQMMSWNVVMAGNVNLPHHVVLHSHKKKLRVVT